PPVSLFSPAGHAVARGHLTAAIRPLSMPLHRSACGRFPDGYSRAVVDAHIVGRKRERGEGFARSRGCPRNCKRRALLDQPLEPADALGRRRKAATREPGYLSTMPTATTPSGGRRMREAMILRLLCRTALAAALSLFATSAFPHHVMGGKTPSTFVEGLLSGLGHPVIGPDHLAFLLAVGIAVGVGGLNLALPALFVVASAIGVVLH